jgi:hypothetical protein
VSGSKQFDIEVHYDDTLRGLTARNLPAVEREPRMPPWETVAATAHLYYPNLRQGGSWDRLAENRAHLADSFAGSESSARRMLAEMELPEDEGPHAKLELVYEWITEQVDNVTFRSTKAAFEAFGEAPETVRCAREVIRERQGDWWDLARTYLALARHLGFEAHLVHAVNRQENFLNLQYYSSKQFDNLFVATRWPDDPDDAWIFNEVGSKLPYGTVPWWNQGSQALMYTEEAAEIVSIPISSATESCRNARPTSTSTKRTVLRRRSGSTVPKGRPGWGRDVVCIGWIRTSARNGLRTGAVLTLLGSRSTASFPGRKTFGASSRSTAKPSPTTSASTKEPRASAFRSKGRGSRASRIFTQENASIP